MVVKPEFHFDAASPNCYFAHRLIPDIEGRTGAKFDYVPILLGGVFKLTGNQSPVPLWQGVKNKPEYMALEQQRFIKNMGLRNFTRTRISPSTR